MAYWTILLIGLLAEVVAVPLLAAKHAARLLAWSLTALAVVFAERWSVDQSPTLRMTVIILSLLFGMKGVVAIETQTRLGWRAWFCFVLGWLGMKPDPFANLVGKPLHGVRRMALSGFWAIALGVLAFALSRWAASVHLWSATALFVVGFSLTVHFGLIAIMAAVWRSLGVDVHQLFRAPWRSTTLSDFWGKRWNLGFVEMTALAIYRPVAAKWGRHVAIFLGFAVSGLFHECAISLPVGAGYGGPTLYFLFHGFLVVNESAWGVAGWGRWGRVWTFGWLIAPLPILFHAPFLRGVIWPWL